MSIVAFVMMVLLGSPLAMAFVLHPSEKESAAPANSPPVTTHNRCRGDAALSIRKGLLGALHLQTEPRLPAGGLSSIREQWRTTFSSITHRVNHSAVVSTLSVTPDGNTTVSTLSVTPDGNTTDLKCCQTPSEVFLKDLGWDNWVIHPESLTFIQCASCSALMETNPLRCPSYPPTVQETPTQMRCCQPTSQEMVPILYMDEGSNVVISSVQLTRSCGCVPGYVPLPNEE